MKDKFFLPAILLCMFLAAHGQDDTLSKDQRLKGKNKRSTGIILNNGGILFELKNFKIGKPLSNTTVTISLNSKINYVVISNDMGLVKVSLDKGEYRVKANVEGCLPYEPPHTIIVKDGKTALVDMHFFFISEMTEKEKKKFGLN